LGNRCCPANAATSCFDVHVATKSLHDPRTCALSFLHTTIRYQSEWSALRPRGGGRPFGLATWVRRQSCSQHTRTNRAHTPTPSTPTHPRAHSPTPTPTPPLAAPTHTNHTPQTPIELVDTNQARTATRTSHSCRRTRRCTLITHPHQRHRTHPDQSSSPAEKHKSPRACGIPTRDSVRRVFCQRT
jgi:hypothetical protein